MTIPFQFNMFINTNPTNPNIGYWQSFSGSESASTTLTVLNVDPTIQSLPPDLTVGIGELVDFSAEATDPGDDLLSYHWNLDGNSTFEFSGQNGQISFDEPGEYPLSVRVTDGDNGMDMDTFTVTVEQLELMGDYNSDGTVDAADYTIWRDTLGQSGDGLAADGDGSGTVDQIDYNLWSANYGASLPDSPSTLQSIPEPSASLLCLIGICLGSIAKPNR